MILPSLLAHVHINKFKINENDTITFLTGICLLCGNKFKKWNIDSNQQTDQPDQLHFRHLGLKGPILKE